VFIVIAVTMTMLGEITGRAFREFTALNAYRWDIIGSILGTLAFTFVSFLRAPSWVWPVVTMVILWALYGLALPWISRISMVLVVGVLVFESLMAGVSWSPYYKVNTETFNVGTPQEFTRIQVNGIPHQNVLDIDERLKIEPVYGRPYERRTVEAPLGKVLIVGAGTGSDVALALKNGAESVDAVEIDPRIQQIGSQINPNKPYADPRVNVTIDDGRAFLSRNDEKYDLILFALPDSLTLVSGASQLRLESYLFTRESIQEAYNHLADDGVFSVRWSGLIRIRRRPRRGWRRLIWLRPWSGSSRNCRGSWAAITPVPFLLPFPSTGKGSGDGVEPRRVRTGRRRRRRLTA
jgi:SAM-dependent methyltransferase